VPDQLVVIGEIVRAHGLRGEVRVTPLTDHPERFDDLAECVLWDPARDRRQWRRIVATRRQHAAVLVALEGCGSLQDAGALTGWLVALPRDRALPLAPGAFYAWQLEGCRVLTEDGHEVGAVTGIERGAAQDLWVVETTERQHLIPAVSEIVVDVDLTARRVVIRPPAGLLDL